MLTLCHRSRYGVRVRMKPSQRTAEVAPTLVGSLVLTTIASRLIFQRSEDAGTREARSCVGRLDQTEVSQETQRCARCHRRRLSWAFVVLTRGDQPCFPQPLQAGGLTVQFTDLGSSNEFVVHLPPLSQPIPYSHIRTFVREWM